MHSPGFRPASGSDSSQGPGQARRKQWHSSKSPPPPPAVELSRGGSTMKLAGIALAAALVATMTASPVTAQTTITAPGLTGQAACVAGNIHRGQPPHINYGSVPNGAGNMMISGNGYGGQITYSFLRGRIGDGGTASSFPVNLTITNTKTGGVVGGLLGTVSSTDTTLTTVMSSYPLTAKTPYFAELWVDVTGLGKANPLDTACFMTGGSYTIGTVSFGTGQTNGCFSISPRTPMDVRNCLCGRPLTGVANTLWQGQTAWDYTSIRSNLGCDPGG